MEPLFSAQNQETDRDQGSMGLMQKQNSEPYGRNLFLTPDQLQDLKNNFAGNNNENNGEDPVLNTESDEFTCFMMQPYFAESHRTNRSILSLHNFDQAEFLFFKMLVLSELLQMPNALSNQLMFKDPSEMFRRAKQEKKALIFY